jgi:uncharacterized protein YukJ
MPIQNYSVLKGQPTAGKIVTGESTHYQITVQATGGPFTVAVNIESTDGSEVLYDIDHTFTPPDVAGLTALPSGMTPLPSQPNGLALDFVREQIDGQPMVTQASLTLLPEMVSAGNAGKKGKREDSISLRAQALTNAVTLLISHAISDGSATLYAFGSAYADSGEVDGIHDIHMNQGNPAPGEYAGDNGIWQDGAMFLQMPSLNSDPSQTWVAVFIAFQTESWNTDNNGNPIS